MGTIVSVLIVHPGGVKTNIIKHAPDIKDAQQRGHAHEVFTQAAFLTSEKAAEKIFHAVKKKKR